MDRSDYRLDEGIYVGNLDPHHCSRERSRPKKASVFQVWTTHSGSLQFSKRASTQDVRAT